jgi:hypothetical protein
LIESRKAGKYSYYSLRDEGRELTRLVAPMMAAKARAVSSLAGEPFEAEAIDFSGLSQYGLSPGVARGQFPSGRVQSWV